MDFSEVCRDRSLKAGEVLIFGDTAILLFRRQKEAFRVVAVLGSELQEEREIHEEWGEPSTRRK